MKYIAHRLFAGNAAENSHSAIDFVLNKRVYGVEVDVQLSKDKVPFLLHDKVLSRTSNVNGYISNYTSEEIQRNIVLSDGLPPPTLSFLLQRLKNTSVIIYLEIIDPASWVFVKDCINSHGCERSKIVISSFHHRVLIEAREDNFETMALFECSPLDPKHFLLKLNVPQIGIGFDSISADTVDAAAYLGIDCFAWTVNDAQELKRAFSFNLSGVFTDRYENLGF